MMRKTPRVQAQSMRRRLLQLARKRLPPTEVQAPDGLMPVGGTADQVLTKVDSADYNAGWETPSGGGGSVYSILKATGDIAGVSFDDTENVLDWTQSFNSGADVTLGASILTIDETGTYKFSVTLRTDNGNRTELFIRTYINGVQDTDEIVSDYVSRDTDQDTGSVTLVTALQLTATDTVQFRGFGDTDGTCVGLNAGTILLVERVA